MGQPLTITGEEQPIPFLQEPTLTHRKDEFKDIKSKLGSFGGPLGQDEACGKRVKWKGQARTEQDY